MIIAMNDQHKQTPKGWHDYSNERSTQTNP